jgi:periplasmic divalent cation tolerance protein
MSDETPESTAFCVVLTTLESEAQAEALAQQIVQARLGACVQVQGIKSFYLWQGQARQERECLLMIKTRSALYARLQDFIRERHSYETPEIVQLPITAGWPDYLAWVATQTLTRSS